MKTTMYFFMVAILLFSFTGCNNDDDPKPPGPDYKGDITVQLSLQDATPSTYAAGDDTEPPITGESELATTLDVFVFDTLGYYEYNTSVSYDNGTRLTGQFLITAGVKFFYVFSNFPGNLPVTGSGMHRSVFEKNIREAVLNNNQTSISQNNQFFIGTLWADTMRVLGTGTTATPEKILLDIGRIAAKIKLNKVPTQGSGALQGAFDSAYYRVRSIPKEFYIVGQHDGDLDEIPPNHIGVQIISAVHEKAPDPAVFFDYLFPDSTLYPPNAGGTQPLHYYTIENTTKPDGEGKLYYGNTTYLQLKVKYRPAQAETYDGTNGDPNIIIGESPGDFYTGILNGSRLIFDSDPTGLGATDVVYYAKGLNYYNIPVKDMSEDELPLQAAVIRNHYYEVNIKSISRLGENTPVVPPDKPIEDDKDIQLEITVLPWSKITYEPEL